MLSHQDGRIWYKYDTEQLSIEPWGPNALRVRATKLRNLPQQQDWALTEKPRSGQVDVQLQDAQATITNGRLKATISRGGKLHMYNQKGQVVLEEYTRHRRGENVLDPKCSALDIEARQFKPLTGADRFHLTYRLESLDPEEKLFGMGQYQQPHLDLKGHDLELAHRNSQASVPFAVSSLGYGILWNNPSLGRVVFGRNTTTFEAFSADILDYWVVAGDTPAEIVEAYSDVTGKVPMMPEYGLGFWQCKLRYQTQEELLGVAREYKRRNLPIDLIVIDFFHWPRQGDWRFDEQYWPDPESMIKELNHLNIALMISIWPTVDKRSENYAEMLSAGHLISVDRGVRTGFDYEGETIHWDATNPAARSYLWDKCKRNYFDKGVTCFWLDEAEPEYSCYDFENYRYWLGPNLSVGNVYPLEYARTFYEGMTAAHQGRRQQQQQEQLKSSSSGGTNNDNDKPPEVVNLIRCAWAGSQRFGALVWSGDIASSWSSLRNQLSAGLNMGLAGIPWWTTDIGGFHGGDPDDAAFRELFVRWFQWGAFCPVMRLHGDREPRKPVMKQYNGQKAGGGASCASGAENEVWSYGEEVLKICERYMKIREGMRGYTRGLMREASEKGRPVMRTLFYEFPNDKRAWEVEGSYMFGGDYMICPVMSPGVRRMTVYFPELEKAGGGKWCGWEGGEFVSLGGEEVEVDCPLEQMPVFVRVKG